MSWWEKRMVEINLATIDEGAFPKGMIKTLVPGY